MHLLSVLYLLTWRMLSSSILNQIICAQLSFFNGENGIWQFGAID